MSDCFLFSLLPGGQDCFSAVFFEEDGSAWFIGEVLGCYLFAVSEGDSEAIGQHGAEFFHEVQGHARTSWSVSVVNSYGGVNSTGFQGGSSVVG